MRIVRRVFLALALSLPGTFADAGPREDLAAIFSQDMASLDLAATKIAIDRMIDPSIDAGAQLAEIDRMAAEVRAMIPLGADSWQKVEVLRRYIYQPGAWNDGRAFAYDLEDPLGEDIRNKLMSDYLTDRRGNCITMPFLFIILGERVGLDVRPALAPLHVLVKFRDDAGR
ncbi:MAG: transglutaminase family protein [Pseudomonadota bacterium]